jgi:histidyl-tRNA synthetase
VGTGGAGADFEVLLLVRDGLRAAGAGDLEIRLNHRGLFNRFLARLGAEDRGAEILRTVDKLPKIGAEETEKLLSAFLGREKAREVLGFVSPGADWGAALESMDRAAGAGGPEAERLRLLRRFMEETGTADDFILDPSITRGLDYYTGLVFESFLRAMPGIGSVCSGGRYDNLVGLYSKENIPGVGGAIGLDRLIAALESLGELPRRESYAELALGCFPEEEAGRAQALAQLFRSGGVPCEVFPGGEEKPGKLFALAEKKGIRWFALPAGEGAGSLSLRDLPARRDIKDISPEQALGIIKDPGQSDL